jgi:hypothetical protein
MHGAATEVKKLSKFGTKRHTKRTFANNIATMPQYQKWYKAATSRRRNAIHRDQPRSRLPLNAGSDEIGR